MHTESKDQGRTDTFEDIFKHVERKESNALGEKPHQETPDEKEDASYNDNFVSGHAGHVEHNVDKYTSSGRNETQFITAMHKHYDNCRSTSIHMDPSTRLVPIGNDKQNMDQQIR